MENHDSDDYKPNYMKEALEIAQAAREGRDACRGRLVMLATDPHIMALADSREALILALQEIREWLDENIAAITIAATVLSSHELNHSADVLNVMADEARNLKSRAGDVLDKAGSA